MIQFLELGLSAPIAKALDAEGYTTPTPVQSMAIPIVLTGADLLGIAQTGTGKTAAFALPILHRLAAEPKRAPRKGCRVLVLSPTRELASQIADSFRTYGRGLGLSVVTVFGGVGHRPQVRALAKGIDILVATPGRLLDHMYERAAVLNGTEILVLDEADQMLDMGFAKPIRSIVSKLSAKRQTLFFSATMPKEISKLAGEFLRNPKKVQVSPVGSTAERVSQQVIHVEARKKRALLAELLTGSDMSRTLVFTRTKRGADRVTKHLETAGLGVAAIHGNKSQRQREVALAAFRKSKISVLVATDIAARGIDVDNVSHVVNYELPDVPEAYVHRIGRTARAGAEGSAISLCDVAERGLLRDIERLTRQTIPTQDRRGDETLEVEVGSSFRGRGGRAHGNAARSRWAKAHDRGRSKPATARSNASEAKSNGKAHGRGVRNDQRPVHRGENGGSGDGPQCDVKHGNGGATTYAGGSGQNGHANRDDKRGEGRRNGAKSRWSTSRKKEAKRERERDRGNGEGDTKRVAGPRRPSKHSAGRTRGRRAAPVA